MLWRARRISRWWILATAAQWCAGGSFSSWQFGTFYSAFTGAVVALAQWLVLRRRIARGGQWIAAATIAWALGQFLGIQTFYGASESPLHTQGLLGEAVSCLVFAADPGNINALAAEMRAIPTVREAWLSFSSAAYTNLPGVHRQSLLELLIENAKIDLSAVQIAQNFRGLLLIAVGLQKLKLKRSPS